MSVHGTAHAALRNTLRHKPTRIIAIPLSRPLARPSTAPPPSVSPSSQPSLNGTAALPYTYYHFQLSSKPKRREKQKAKLEQEEGSEKTKDGEPKRWSLVPEGGISAWVQTKAAETWAGFGKAEGGWKRYVFRTGERIVDRMEFEELALKSIDPSLGPRITHPRSSEMESSEGLKEKEQGGAGVVPVRIPLIYPPSALTSQLAMSELRMYVQHRIPVHRKGFFLWVCIAPLTAPFMIIPIIPNLPFFFCVWRSWSHYKAYRASQYLEKLLDQGAIVPEPSEDLDAVYSEFPSRSLPSPPTSTQPSSSPPPPQHELLLRKDAIPALVERFDLGAHASADLYRAFEQVRVRVFGEGAADKQNSEKRKEEEASS